MALIDGGRKHWLWGVAALGFATTWIVGAVGPSTAGVDRRTVAVVQPRLVYASPGDTGERPRLHGAWIGREATIGLGREASVREAAFVVDEPPTSTRIYATDRTAPIVVPRRGTQGKHPYALGVHTLRADVELRSGRHIRLQVAYTVARTLNVPATVTRPHSSALSPRWPQGRSSFVPAPGESSVSVSGDISLTRALVAIDRAHVSGLVEFGPRMTRSKLTRSSALGFDIGGADDILIDGNAFDGQGIDAQNTIGDSRGDTPDGWVIRNNTFQNYFIDDGVTHSEALFIGYSTRGLIENNTFTNNGNTGHFFFTWFGDTADPTSSYPRNIFVRDNTFKRTRSSYFDVQFRAEIPPTANIVIQRGVSSTRREFYGAC